MNLSDAFFSSLYLQPSLLPSFFLSVFTCEQYKPLIYNTKHVCVFLETPPLYQGERSVKNKSKKKKLKY